MPTPPAAPCTSSRSPEPQPGLREERVVRGREDLGEAAGRGPVERVGDGHRLALVHDASSACPPPPTIAITRSPSAKRSAPGPRADDLAGQLQAGDVRRRARAAPGRRRARCSMSAPLRPAAAHADEHLAGPGSRVGVVVDEHLAVADRGGAHGGGV